jgi:hypothetical protein
MTQPPARDAETDAEGVFGQIGYLSSTVRTSRRFVGPRGERHTDSFEPRRVKIYNGRPLQDRFSFDEQGFQLVRHPCSVSDFYDRTAVDTSYTDESVALVKALTGAELVVSLGWNLRSSGPISTDGVYPPSSDVHIDFSNACAQQVARRFYDAARPGGPGYSRSVFMGLWRPLTPPPQDWPFAVCDARTVDPNEGLAKPIVPVDVLPEGDAMFAPIAGEETLLATVVMPFNPAHRWWYFPNMTPDEAVLFKHHDSDRTRAWRVPHTSFRDTSFPDAGPRQSIEFRTVAYFR